jgi:hypothetical protein
MGVCQSGQFDNINKMITLTMITKTDTHHILHLKLPSTYFVLNLKRSLKIFLQKSDLMLAYFIFATKSLKRKKK